MNKVNRESIKQLLEHEDNTTLSIYLPTHRFPTSEYIDEDRIRFKNLLRRGEEELKASGVSEAIIEQMRHELTSNFYENDELWQHTTEGLAVFCSPAGSRYFHLPIECSEYLGVGDGYDITPLLLLSSCDNPYYLLAVAVHDPVLYKGDMYGIERVAIDLPENPEKALGIDELFSNSQTVRAGSYGAGNPGTKSHGQGDSRQAGQEERLKFFRLVDDKLRTSNIDVSLPFLIAGSGDDVSAYRESSKLKTIMEPSLSGNYTEVATHEIHEKAWPIIERELCEKEQEKSIEKINSLLGTGRASTSASDIEAAAKDGRVDTLLVGALTLTRDTVKDSESESMKMVISDKYNEQEVSECGRIVFDQGGTAIGVLDEIMPDGAYQAALYRY